LSLFIVVILLESVLAVGLIMSFEELGSLKTQISDLKEQVTKVVARDEVLAFTVENLNDTVRHLVNSVQNRSMVEEVSRRGFNGLVLQLNVNDLIKTGETVRVNFSLTNFGSQKVTLVFPSPKIFDFKVLDSSGKVVYEWSQDKSFPALIVEIALEPGQTKTASLPWECKLPPGEYVIIGIVSSYNMTITATKVIRVSY
jgi:regulator of replication initiation timing